MLYLLGAMIFICFAIIGSLAFMFVAEDKEIKIRREKFPLRSDYLTESERESLYRDF